MSVSVEGTVRHQSMNARVEQLLTDRLAADELRPGDQIPPEAELAASIGVSRVVVRTAIGALVRRGVLTQRQGVGTFVSVGSALTNDLREALDFTVLLERMGGAVGVEFDSVAIVSPPTAVAAVLELDHGARVVQTSKRLTSDGATVIYVVNSIPVGLLGEPLADEVVADPAVSEPLFAFLEGSTGRRVSYQLASLQAELGTDVLHPAADLGGDVPVLRFDEVGYTAGNEPVWHSSSWFPPGTMTFELIRQRSESL